MSYHAWLAILALDGYTIVYQGLLKKIRIFLGVPESTIACLSWLNYDYINLFDLFASIVAL